MSNFWPRLLDRLNMPENPTSKDWKGIIDNHSDKRYALRLLALAYLDSNRDEVCNLNNMRELATRELGFDYQCFTQYRDALSSKLKWYNVELLKKNGDNQYLRTIQKYS